MSQPLVVDASVVRAAGGAEAVHPTSKRCRDFLTVVLEVCHRVVVTDRINAEWREHGSTFARKWQLAMYARKKVERVTPQPNDLDAKLGEAIDHESDREAVLKDVHVLHAALATARRVVSRDDKARSILRSACSRIPQLRDIVWVNPTHPAETVEGWLRSGAPDEARRRLGAE